MCSFLVTNVTKVLCTGEAKKFLGAGQFFVLCFDQFM